MPYTRIPNHTDEYGNTWDNCVLTWDTTPEEDAYIRDVLKCGPQLEDAPD